MTATIIAPCRRCGCAEKTHEHYRPGSDCGHCGRQTCPQFRQGRWWRKWWGGAK